MAGILQISGASLHVVGSFFWRLYAYNLVGEGPSCELYFWSTVVIVGELVETTAITLTLDDDFFVTALCLLGTCGVLGPILLGSTATNDLCKLRRSVVWVGEILYIGSVAIATVQNAKNTWLLFPEVPLDFVEEFTVTTMEKNNDDNKDANADADTGTIDPASADPYA